MLGSLNEKPRQPINTITDDFRLNNSSQSILDNSQQIQNRSEHMRESSGGLPGNAAGSETGMPFLKALLTSLVYKVIKIKTDPPKPCTGCFYSSIFSMLPPLPPQHLAAVLCTIIGKLNS